MSENTQKAHFKPPSLTTDAETVGHCCHLVGKVRKEGEPRAPVLPAVVLRCLPCRLTHGKVDQLTNMPRPGPYRRTNSVSTHGRWLGRGSDSGQVFWKPLEVTSGTFGVENR